MKIKLTLMRPGGPEVDISVVADAAATIGDLAQMIAKTDPFVGKVPQPERATLSVRADGGATRSLDSSVALAEAPIAPGSTVVVVAEGDNQRPASTSTRTLVTLTAVEGPGAPAQFALAEGSHLVGREPGSPVQIDDPLVSKRHARLDVGPGGVRIVDLNSANGIIVDDTPVTRVDLVDGQRLLIGDTHLQVGVSASASASSPWPDGPIDFVRSPRVERRYAGDEHVAPQLPAEQDSQPFPWLAMVAPLILGGVMFAVTRSPLSIVFVALSPVLIISNFVSSGLNRRRKLRIAIEKFDARLGDLDGTLARAIADEQGVRTREHASTAEVIEAARNRSELLWTRRPEHWSFLSLRLGTADLPSRNTVKIAGEDVAIPEYLHRLRAMVDRHRLVASVPLVENLHESGGLGIAATPDIAADVARSLLVQLTGLHSPSELVVTAVIGDSWIGEFDWLKWLPHTSSAQSPIPGIHLANSAPTGLAVVSQLEELVEQRRRDLEPRGAGGADSAAMAAGAVVARDPSSATPPPSPTPAVVVLITDDAPVPIARLIQLSERSADAGVFPIWIARTRAALPAVARTYIDATVETAQAGFVRLGEMIEPLAIERTDAYTAREFARHLAPVQDGGALTVDSSDLPNSVALVSLLGSELASSSDSVVERWRQNGSIHDRSGTTANRPRRAGRLRAIVGQSGIDAMHLDLREHGPHALVGGTTGSGKSEFLQAWVLAMAAEYSPDRVTFLFVDYKGGSAFADCVRLPHCVGLVTDLSPHLVRRALTSLRAELHHRERLLNERKAKDLLELEKRGDPDSPPALVLVIDEFAALVGEVPEFVDGVVDIAQRGRSLGIHLVMATQRPAGVIRDNLRANTNLRIALRMADESDSQDVVGDKVAGGFDPAIPGRAVAKTGPGRLTSFQSAYAGGRTSAQPPAPSVRISELRFGAEVPWEESAASIEAAPSETGPTDQARLVATIGKAASAASIPAARRPWLDELPPAFDLTKLRQRSDTELLLGVSDLPEFQRQDQVSFLPDRDGSIAIFGTGGSGKSVALRTLAAAAGITPRGGPVDVYGIDYASGGLRMLEVLPHVGSIVGGDDPDRIARLLRMLSGELEARSDRYTNAGSIVDYRKQADRPDEPRILLLIDGFPAFRQEFDGPAARAPWYQAFQQILTDGRKLGIHVALTADRPGSVPTSITSNIQRRVVLRLADESSYSLLDVPTDILGPKSPPGRAIIDDAETQIAIVGGASSVSEQSHALAVLAEAIERTGRAAAVPIGTLPKEIPRSELPADLDGEPVLGLSDEDLAPIGFTPEGVLLIAGPPGSGRSNALDALAVSVSQALPKAVFSYLGTSRSLPARGVTWKNIARSIEEAAELAKALLPRIQAEPRQVIFIEGIGEFLSTAADGPIVELIKAVKRSPHLLIAESETSSWGSSWPLLTEVKSARRGVILQPEHLEGETIFKTSLPRGSRSDFPPGRGYYVARGKAIRVQLPLAD